MRKRLSGSPRSAKEAARAALILAAVFVALLWETALAEKVVPFRENEGAIIVVLDGNGSVSVLGHGELAPAGTAQGLLVAEAAGQNSPDLVAVPAEARPKAPSPPPTTKVPLFNSKTVEFRGLLQKSLPKWQRVVTEEKRSPTFGGDLSKLMRAGLYREWQKLVENCGNASDLEKAKAVTAFFNRWPYRTDKDVYKIEDYWATPREFLKNSGDCEDYAITKFYALIALGIDPDKMRIVALMDTLRNLGHAVLVLYTDETAYVMDNMNSLILPHTDVRVRHYDPKIAANLIYRWAYVKSTKPKK